MKSVLVALLGFASTAHAEQYFCISSPEIPDVLYVLTATDSDEEPVSRVESAIRYEGQIEWARITSSDWNAAVKGAKVTHEMPQSSRAGVKLLIDSAEEMGGIELRKNEDKSIAVAAPLIGYPHFRRTRLEISAVPEHRGEQTGLMIDGKNVKSIVYQHCGDD